MSKTYDRCPAEGWYWVRIGSDQARRLRWFNADGEAFCEPNGICTGHRWAIYRDHEPVEIRPREIPAPVPEPTTGELLVSRLHRLNTPLYPGGVHDRVARAIDAAIAEAVKKAEAERDEARAKLGRVKWMVGRTIRSIVEGVVELRKSGAVAPGMELRKLNWVDDAGRFYQKRLDYLFALALSGYYGEARIEALLREEDA